MYHHSNTNARFRQPPSFSATLLDKIYRSIDEPESDRIRKQSSRTKQNPHRNDKEDPLLYSSNSSSSNSSSLGLSSSDTESTYGVQPKLRAASAFLPPPPKPVKITVPSRSEKQRRVSTPLVDSQIFSTAEAIHDEGIIKSKSRALRIYANLKKAKTPISPGGRLSSFINSLFTPANAKKSKHSPSIHNVDDVNVEKTSNYSSASSFSRSCLSNKSPGRRNAAKRSVRFLNEDLKPGGRKFLSEDSGRFQKKNNLIDDDASSCSSSDLFELDHLSVMGMDSRYCEELPVYQTTHFRVR